MRNKLVIIAVLVAVCLQGCVVKSIYPFYKESDVVYQKALEGIWHDQDNHEWDIHQNPFKPNSYELHYSKNGREVVLLGHLFKIDGNTYFDMVPSQDNSEDMPIFDVHLVPTHSIARIEKLTNQSVIIKWLNEEWLNKMFAEKRIKIRHEFIMDESPSSKDDGIYLLTASTEELQAFIAKYGNDEQAYDSDLRLQLTK